MDTIAKDIDALGRIHIPKSIRDSLNIDYGDRCEISLDQDRIVIKPYRSRVNFNQICQYLTLTLKLPVFIISDKGLIVGQPTIYKRSTTDVIIDFKDLISPEIKHKLRSGETTIQLGNVNSCEWCVKHVTKVTSEVEGRLFVDYICIVSDYLDEVNLKDSEIAMLHILETLVQQMYLNL